MYVFNNSNYEGGHELEREGVEKHRSWSGERGVKGDVNTVPM